MQITEEPSDVEARYIRDALAGRSSDWAHFDHEASAECLVEIRRILMDASRPAAENHVQAGDLIMRLIERNACRHAEQCAANGTLE